MFKSILQQKTKGQCSFKWTWYYDLTAKEVYDSVELIKYIAELNAKVAGDSFYCDVMTNQYVMWLIR